MRHQLASAIELGAGTNKTESDESNSRGKRRKEKAKNRELEPLWSRHRTRRRCIVSFSSSRVIVASTAIVIAATTIHVCSVLSNNALTTSIRTDRFRRWADTRLQMAKSQARQGLGKEAYQAPRSTSKHTHTLEGVSNHSIAERRGRGTVPPPN